MSVLTWGKSFISILSLKMMQYPKIAAFLAVQPEERARKVVMAKQNERLERLAEHKIEFSLLSFKRGTKSV